MQQWPTALSEFIQKNEEDCPKADEEQKQPRGEELRCDVCRSFNLGFSRIPALFVDIAILHMKCGTAIAA